MSLIRSESLNKIYHTGNEEIQVLRDINLDFEQGKIYIITGESGSGKSTLLNLIGGIDNPSSGSIWFRDQDITHLNEDALTRFRMDFIGFIFQFHFLLKDFSAIENVMMPALIAQQPMAAAKTKASKLLAEVGLSHRENHYLTQLSGGERQRVALARALMNDPPVIIADEPTGNLDEGNTRLVEDVLFSLVTKLSKTLIMVTHNSHFKTDQYTHYQLDGGRLSQL
ncbi:MAG: ABC transporter ATP-binding protein [Spirochaetales bacterium]|nr:ABC transporter ATP-binding protein [Spirochaetales bacterium]